VQIKYENKCFFNVGTIYRICLFSDDFYSDNSLILTTVLKQCMDIGARHHMCGALGLYTLSCIGAVVETGTSSINWVQLCKFHLNTETESNYQNVEGCLNKNTRVDNVQTHNICIYK
jgi:hypothetical protein